AELTGVEIDENAFYEAQFNVSESIFKERCKLVHSSLQAFNSEEKFDLILSNPPFFELTHKENSSRNKVRQQSDYTFKELLFHSEKLLNPNGKLAIIIPFESESYFISLASELNLFPQKITRVKGNENAKFKRSLILLSKTTEKTSVNELTIEISRHQYS